MSLALIIALIALLVALAALFLAVRRAGGGGGIVRYTIKGNVEIINDCDGLLASIPAQVNVKSNLNDNQGNSSGGNTLVNVAPDPADPPGTPRKIGTYSITVVWGPGFGNPANWDTPEATLPNGRDICPSIACPGPGSRCIDGATRTRTVPFANPTTTYDLRVSCSCVGP